METGAGYSRPGKDYAETIRLFLDDFLTVRDVETWSCNLVERVGYLHTLEVIYSRVDLYGSDRLDSGTNFNFLLYYNIVNVESSRFRS